MTTELTSSFVARQAIVDINSQIVGYELLFRDGWKNCFPDISDEIATSKIIVDNYLDYGIEKLVGQHRAFINFSERALLDNYPDAMDKDNIVIEILETVEPSEEVISACREYADKGYTLALDDHDFDKKWEPLVDLVNIIKVDISDFSATELVLKIKEASKAKCTLLAERVETLDEFEFCKKLGFDLFQGYFFAKPEIIEKKKLSTNQMSMMQLLAETAANDLQLDKISEILSRDASLTLKLLRFINSPGFGKVAKIGSLKHALTYLGQTELRKFVALLAMSGMGEEKSPALLSLAVVRARFCEQLLVNSNNEAIAGTGFLTGLFSLIDAVLNDTKENIFSKFPIDERIKSALDGDGSIPSHALNLAIAYENSDWESVSAHSVLLGDAELAVGDIYTEAVDWASALDTQ